MTFETLSVIYELLLEKHAATMQKRHEAYRAFVKWRAEHPNLPDNEYPDYHAMEESKSAAEDSAAALHEFQSVKWSGVAGTEG